MYAKYKKSLESTISTCEQDKSVPQQVNCNHPKESLLVATDFILNSDLGVIYTYECQICETKLVQYSTITGIDDLRSVQFVNDIEWLHENEPEIYEFAFPLTIENVFEDGKWTEKQPFVPSAKTADSDEGDSFSEYCQHKDRNVCIYRRNLGDWDHGMYDFEYSFKCEKCGNIFYCAAESCGEICENRFNDEKDKDWITKRGLTLNMNIDYWRDHIYKKYIPIKDVEEV